MNAYSLDLWGRARKALLVAKSTLALDSDAAASRAYYAAFYAVSAYFALKGQTFKRHSAVESAVHRDLVKAGLWPRELGAGYSALMELRSTGDYGDLEHVSDEEAYEAVKITENILRAVADTHPEIFTGLEEI